MVKNIILYIYLGGEPSLLVQPHPISAHQVPERYMNWVVVQSNQILCDPYRHRCIISPASYELQYSDTTHGSIRYTNLLLSTIYNGKLSLNNIISVVNIGPY